MTSSITETAREKSPSEIPTYFLLRQIVGILDFVPREAHHAAFYLAQRTSATCLYPYRLAIGHVVSDDLAAELSLIEASTQASAPALHDTIEMLVAALQRDLELWLQQSDDTLEATATEVFFREHKYGEPSTRLKWYRDIPEENRTRAQKIARVITEGMPTGEQNGGEEGRIDIARILGSFPAEPSALR